MDASEYRSIASGNRLARGMDSVSARREPLRIGTDSGSGDVGAEVEKSRYETKRSSGQAGKYPSGSVGYTLDGSEKRIRASAPSIISAEEKGITSPEWSKWR